MSVIAASTRAVSESPRPSKPVSRAKDPWTPATAPVAAALPASPAPARAARVGGRAVVLDVETSSRRQLCGELTASGWEITVVGDIDGLSRSLRADADAAPDLVVAEYRLAGKCVLDLLDAVPRELWPRLVIVTSYGSVASAVRAIKLGVGGYLAKPASGAHVLRVAGHEAASVEDPPASYLSLDRAIWEVLTEAVEQAGTVSGAARRLGLHARSLRRMLAKYPPAR